MLLIGDKESIRKANEASLIRLYAFYKQGKLGPAPRPANANAITTDQQRAWKKLGAMDKATARKIFVSELYYFDPTWDYSAS